MAAIRSMMQEGGMVAGTSAGIMALTDTVVINSGVSHSALVYGAWDMAAVNNSDILTYDSLGEFNISPSLASVAHIKLASYCKLVCR